MNVENAISDVKKALEGDDKDAIERKSRTLAEASAGLAQKLYADQQGGGDSDGKAESSAQGDDDVVDAEFEEVDQDESKRA